MSIGRISRRRWLCGAGAALALPALEYFQPKSALASEGKRLVVMYTPNGSVPSSFWPSGGGREWTLSPILQPLAAHQQDLTVVGGLDILTARGPGDPHQRGTGACLTGRPLLEGSFSGDAEAVAGWASGISIDQHVAAHFAGQTPLPSAELGVMVEDPTVRGRISYAGPGKPLPPENSPAKVYQRVFEPGLSASEKALRRVRRRAVLDRLEEQVTSLQAKLGQDDRTRLESHIESLQELDLRLQRPGIELGGRCGAIEVPEFLEKFNYAQLPEVGKAQMDVMAMLFRCDVTRVASIMWTHSQSTASYPIAVRFGGRTFNTTGGHHGVAHKGDDEAEYVAKNVAIQRFFAEQLSYLIDQLKAIPEGEGTAFDNTLILWTNEQNKGNTHDMGDMPYVLAGNAGGALEAGQYLRLAPDLSERKGMKGESHNRLLTTVAQAMGMGDTEFGDSAEYSSSAIAELLK